MIINIDTELQGFSRYNGGWIKSITGLDKNYKNGFSLVGDFLPVSSGNIDLEENVLYIDCSIDGSRKNWERNYHLFKIVEGKIHTIQSIEDGGKDWATSLWKTIENELDLIESPVDEIIRKIDKLNGEQVSELLVRMRENGYWYQKFLETYLPQFVNESNEFKNNVGEYKGEVE